MLPFRTIELPPLRIGEENYCGSLLAAFAEPFGMEAFIGKKVVVFSDVHLDGAPLSKLSIATERVKSITGEDLVSVNRKYVKYWHGRLQTRLIVPFGVPNPRLQAKRRVDEVALCDDID